jgi:hypothetical protein
LLLAGATACRAGIIPAEEQRLFTAYAIAGLSPNVPLDADAVNAALDSLENFSDNTVRTVIIL